MAPGPQSSPVLKSPLRFPVPRHTPPQEGEDFLVPKKAKIIEAIPNFRKH